MALSTIAIVLVVMGFLIAFAIGANDESMSTTVGSGTFSVRSAVLVGGVVAFLGVVFLSGGVGKTIGVGLLSPVARSYYDDYLMLAVLASTTIWLIVGSLTGAPLSTTHSVVGCIFGVGLVISINANLPFAQVLNGSKMTSVVLAWFISPTLGYFGALGVQLAMQKWLLPRFRGLESIERSEKKFAYLLLVTVLVTQISRGGNDAANAIGVFYALAEANPGDVPLTGLVVASAACLALGIVVIGRIVIRNLGENLVEMRPSDAFSIQLSVSLLVLICTLLGLPISGTHILVFAMLGNAKARSVKSETKNLAKMVATWVLTFPVAMLVAMAFYAGFIHAGLVTF
ncbi:MAG: inorganic phosphate transporter [Promethearchaeota archaeon]